MRMKGTSCHQCKSKKSSNTLVHCSKVLDKNHRVCRKKYCLTCLSKYYTGQLSNNFDKFICPSCKEICACASCAKKYRGVETAESDIHAKSNRSTTQKGMSITKKRHYSGYGPHPMPFTDPMKKNGTRSFNQPIYRPNYGIKPLPGMPSTDYLPYKSAASIENNPFGGYFDLPNEEINNSFLTETEKELLKPLDIRKLLYSNTEYDRNLEDPGYIARIPIVKEQIQIILQKDISEEHKIKNIKNLLKEYRNRLKNNKKRE